MYDTHPASKTIVYRSWRNEPSATRRLKILILKLDHIGDLWMSIGPLRKFRLSFSEAHIILVVGSWNIETAKRFNLADDYVIFDFFSRSPQLEKTRRRPDEINSVLAGQFDLAVDMRVPDDTRSVLLEAPADTLAAVADPKKYPGIEIFVEAPKIKLRRSVMYKLIQRSPLFGRIPRRWIDRNIDVDQRRIRHVAETLSSLVARVSDYYEPLNRPGMGERASIDSSAPIVVAPFSNSSLRDWPIERFNELVAALSRSRSVILVGRSEHSDALWDIALSAPPANRANIDVADDLTEDGFNDLLGSAALVVSNNSGAGHVAAQLGRPTLGVFSASHLPDLWGFQGPRVSMLMSSIECRGCGLDVIRRCPIEVRCKTDITVEAVLTEIAALSGIGTSQSAETPTAPSAAIHHRAMHPVAAHN